MKTVLIGWELGAGRGHVERLLPIMKTYLQEGWRVVAALRDLPLAMERFAGLQGVFGACRLKLLQAPQLQHRPFPTAPIVSLAQIHCYLGYDKPQVLAALSRAWERYLREYRPELVLSDASPALNLAARQRVPLTVIGNGWSVPPDQDSVPLLRAEPETIQWRDFETRITRCAGQVVGSHRGPTRFCDLLRGEENRVFTLPELDPYQKVRSDPLLWPPELPEPRRSGTARKTQGLIYLPRSHPAQTLVKETCGNSTIPFKAWFEGVGVGQSGGLRVEKEPFDLVSEVPRARLVIHHGGLGTAIWCLANRVSQLICPQDLEKTLVAEAVARNGGGAIFDAQMSKRKFKSLVDDLVKSE